MGFIKKYSARELPKAKRKLWSLLSRLIRDRDGNTCYSCGSKNLFGSGWHAGHMFPAGSHSVLRFHPDNIHSQCYKCNINLGGNGAEYAARFIKNVGQKAFDMLMDKSRSMKKWYVFEIEELIEKASEGIETYSDHYYKNHGPDLSGVLK